jgi:hypothetical protein
MGYFFHGVLYGIRLHVVNMGHYYVGVLEWFVFLEGVGFLLLFHGVLYGIRLHVVNMGHYYVGVLGWFVFLEGVGFLWL